jgi:hypothetical protein
MWVRLSRDGSHVRDPTRCPPCYHLLPRVRKLKQLRYLNAQRVQYKLMPMCMTKLSKSNYLNLHGSLITKLPESMGKMKFLMHLDLSYIYIYFKNSRTPKIICRAKIIGTFGLKTIAEVLMLFQNCYWGSKSWCI